GKRLTLIRSLRRQGPVLQYLDGGETDHRLRRKPVSEGECEMPDSDVRIVAGGLGFPEGPVWMADGSVILGEISGAKVTRITPDGRTAEIGKAGGGPNGVATGPDGALYVCNNGGAVYQSTPSFLSTGPALDYTGGCIQRIDPKTGATRVLYS